MARIVSRTRAGEPKAGMRKFYPAREFRWPVFKKQRINTLIKRNEAKGVTMPEAHNITSAKGVDTGGGFASRASVKLQKPFVRPGFTSRPGKTVTKAPKIQSSIRRRKQGP